MTATLDDTARQQLNTLLLKRLQEIERQQKRHLGGQSRADHAREVLLQDGDDAPQRDADREVDLAMADRDVVERAEIEAALQRMAQGRYGRCVDCAEDIPYERLALEPQTLRCIGCAQRAERGRPPHASM